MAYINHIQTAVPDHKYAQSMIADFMIACCDNISEAETTRIKLIFQNAEIEERYSVLEDFGNLSKDWTFFDSNANASIQHRMKKYFEEAPPLALQSILKLPSNELAEITHLITVSCTGMAAPGIDIMLAKELGFSNSIHRTSVNFMGCYAMLHALKQANYICESDAKAKVLIAGVELCTLHFQSSTKIDNIAASALFSDGAACAIVSSEPKGLGLKKFASYLGFNGDEHMAWNIHENGFLMNLSSYVPSIIGKSIKPLLEELLFNLEIDMGHIKHWAIHPGGKKILNEVSQALDLENTALDKSRQILKKFGNMSSVTILFVLEYYLNNRLPSENIIATAFGPGLTIETALIETC